MAAFTRVATHRSLPSVTSASSHDIPSSPPMKSIESSPEKKSSGGFSNEVRKYVSRAFDLTVPDITHDEISAKLREIISDAARAGRLNTTDWENHVLPQYIIRQERLMKETPQPVKLESPPAPAVPETVMLNMHPTNKRKSSEMSSSTPDPSTSTSAVPPWRNPTVTSSNSFESRLSFSNDQSTQRADKRQKKFQESSATLKQSSKFNGDLERRRQRFNLGTSSPTKTASRDDSPTADGSEGPVIGTCQDLEKRYFRLTSAPKPEAVRPLAVLRKTLELLKKKWKTEHNYNYICDQFKSLRQDLTVQHITNEFTVTVYEIHARIALEKGDLGEYNQCQTQLRALYKRNLGGHPGEFLAYRILYLIYTGNQTDTNALWAELTEADRQYPAVRHALQLRSALAVGNYHRFFKLYLNTPNIGAYLADKFIPRERLSALSTICKTYKPDISLKVVADELSFETEAACAEFIGQHGGAGLIEVKDGVSRFASGKAGQIIEAAKAAASGGVDIKGQI